MFFGQMGSIHFHLKLKIIKEKGTKVDLGMDFEGRAAQPHVRRDRRIRHVEFFRGNNAGSRNCVSSDLYPHALCWHVR